MSSTTLMQDSSGDGPGVRERCGRAGELRRLMGRGVWCLGQS